METVGDDYFPWHWDISKPKYGWNYQTDSYVCPTAKKAFPMLDKYMYIVEIDCHIF